jgi:DNA repair exonuclease SbcCD ATPase subunit
MNEYDDDYEEHITAPIIEEHRQVVAEYLKRLGELIEEVVQLRATETRLQSWYDEQRDEVIKLRDRIRDANKEIDEIVAKKVATKQEALDKEEKDFQERIKALKEAEKSLRGSTSKANVGDCVFITKTRYGDDFVVFKSLAKAKAYVKGKDNTFSRVQIHKAVIL